MSEVDRPSEVQFYCLKGETKRIQKRSEQRIVCCLIYSTRYASCLTGPQIFGKKSHDAFKAGDDESDNEEQEELPRLTLETHDFLRDCAEHQDAIVPEGKLLLPLAQLREHLAKTLIRERTLSLGDASKRRKSAKKGRV